jgi:chemotaxis protein histidine kinase CheA
VTGASGYYAPSWMQKRVSKPNKRWDDEPNSPPRRKQAKKQTKAQRAAAKKKQLADEAESERKRVAAAAKAAATEATRRAKELAAQERLRAKAAREAETARVRKEREDAKARKDREKEEQKAAKEAEKRKPAEAVAKLAKMAGISESRMRLLVLGDESSSLEYKPRRGMNEPRVAVSYDDFVEHAAEMLALMFTDDFIYGSAEGKKALWQVAELFRPAHNRRLSIEEDQPSNPGDGEPDGYAARVLFEFHPVLLEMWSFYTQLIDAVLTTKDVDGAVDLIHREWKLGPANDDGKLQKAWEETPLGCSVPLLLYHWEKKLFKYFMSAVADVDEPSWEEPPAASFSSDEAEHLYYVTGWAFRAVEKAVRRLTYQKSATEAETKLAHMAQFLRHDLNISDAPTQAVFVDAVERKPGALFRATEPAALFGEELEARIHSWLTTARLACSCR